MKGLVGSTITAVLVLSVLLSPSHAVTIEGTGASDDLQNGRAGGDTSASDVLQGTADADLIYGRAGGDTIYGNDGADTIIGGAGPDRIFAGNGDDIVDGGDGNDFINGGAGRDTLRGGNGNDEIRGFDGNDVLLGGNGDDQLYGGGGRDTFVIFNGENTIMDFSINDDKIEFNPPQGVSWTFTVTSDGSDTFITDGTNQVSIQLSNIVATYSDLNSAGVFTNPDAVQFTNSGSGVEGDPHFTLWNGTKYDYHGQCDLVIIQDPSFADGVGLELHARTTLVFGQYSFIGEAAVMIGKDMFYLHSLGDFAIDGVKGDQVNVTDSTFGGFPFSHWHSGKVYYHRFLIYLDGRGAKIELKAFENIIYINISERAKRLFQGSKGMLGEGTTGRMVGRDGETIYEDPAELAREWQVRDTDTKLFEINRRPQFPEECITPGATKLRISSPISRDSAEQACAKWMVDKEQCIFDVMATGKYEIAVLKDVDKEANAAEAEHPNMRASASLVK